VIPNIADRFGLIVEDILIAIGCLDSQPEPFSIDWDDPAIKDLLSLTETGLE
jgi:hypothetical protein